MGMWIRRDQSDGTLTEVEEARVAVVAQCNYVNAKEAMAAATEAHPICNAFACYWPKPS